MNTDRTIRRNRGILKEGNSRVESLEDWSPENMTGMEKSTKRLYSAQMGWSGPSERQGLPAKMGPGFWQSVVSFREAYHRTFFYFINK